MVQIMGENSDLLVHSNLDFSIDTSISQALGENSVLYGLIYLDFSIILVVFTFTVQDLGENLDLFLLRFIKLSKMLDNR